MAASVGFKVRARLVRGTALLAVGSLLAACGASGSSPAPTLTVTAPITNVRQTPPEPTIPLVWPLTGMPTDQEAKNPSLAIKIENSSTARPQTGLEFADMVWETVVEGGISRFIAVYNSEIPKEVGPVRSVRPMDPYILGSFGGLLAFSGGKRAFVDRVGKTGLQAVSADRGNAGFFRTPTRRAPHNVLGTPKKFLEQAKGKNAKPVTQQFAYASEPEQATAAVSGKPAKGLSITLSGLGHPSWDWDGKTSKYLRSEGSTPAVSSAGTRLSATNIVVLEVSVNTLNYRDAAGTPVPESIVVGSGKALVVSGGKAIEATWSKKKPTSKFILKGGKDEIKLAPGNTWFEVMPKTGSWTIK